MRLAWIKHSWSTIYWNCCIVNVVQNNNDMFKISSSNVSGGVPPKITNTKVCKYLDNMEITRDTNNWKTKKPFCQIVFPYKLQLYTRPLLFLCSCAFTFFHPSHPNFPANSCVLLSSFVVSCLVLCLAYVLLLPCLGWSCLVLCCVV